MQTFRNISLNCSTGPIEVVYTSSDKFHLFEKKKETEKFTLMFGRTEAKELSDDLN